MHAAWLHHEKQQLLISAVCFTTLWVISDAIRALLQAIFHVAHIATIRL